MITSTRPLVFRTLALFAALKRTYYYFPFPSSTSFPSVHDTVNGGYTLPSSWKTWIESFSPGQNGDCRVYE